MEKHFNLKELTPEDFVLVQYQGKKTVKHFVEKIVDSLRKIETFSVTNLVHC